ncbi:MAG TPA: RsmB/NOP family class I SAM-dependent RNA methyltransferase [Rhizomicrobium sp.]|jgi:16S rRNA (cytosine967-C5)-methyltransferase|nr:RsmB/NOP family class I SAM-dependent RNA methyltransferase [Rhizomicrobium sp.]
MTPAARAQAAIDILEDLEKTAQPADRYLRDYFRARRYAGSKDRAAVAERVFAVLRHRAALAWQMQDDAPRALVLASIASDGEDIDLIFTGQRYAPAALGEDERKAWKTNRGEPPLCVEGAFPQFLEPELRKAFGDGVLHEMAALQARAPVDLRVNTLRTRREDVLRALHDMGFDAAPTPFAPQGVRLAPGQGSAKLGTLAESSAFEFQDEASQIAALLIGAKPGMRILDLAAGAGGKSLALAAAADNQAEIVASDVRDGALEQLRKRADRAGAHIIVEKEPRGTFDAVLVDAPCSGTGTWRRQPELRWRLTPSRLDQLTALQDELLDRAAAFVKPGGRLIYATCSILPRENEVRVAAFLARNRAFKSLRADAGWGESAPPGLGEVFRATPYSTGTDGFFAAILARAAP